MSKRLTAARCVEYLRGLGVEISGATADEWDIAERVYKYLRHEKNTVREGRLWICPNQHTRVVETDRRVRRKNRPCMSAAPCPVCGLPWNRSLLLWTEARDGTVRDHRPEGERWRPLDSIPDWIA